MTTPNSIIADLQADNAVLLKQRDELIKALERQVADAKHCQRVMCNEIGVGFLDVVTIANSDAAIASVKGGA